MNQYSDGGDGDRELEDFSISSAYNNFIWKYSTAATRTLRVTTCDIMCTTNTSRLYEQVHVRKANKSAQLPYKRPDVLPAFSSGATDVQLLVNSESKKKHCKKLKEEREEFLCSLKESRVESKRLEMFAATKIQALFRGYRRRRGEIDCGQIEKYRIDHPKLTSVEDIRSELTLWAAKIKLKPIYGISLESTIRKSAHQKHLEKSAAMKVKYFLRVVVACSKVNKRRQEVLQEKINAAATTINRFFKYIVFQTKLEGVVALLKKKGAVQIQTYCRGFLARFRYSDFVIACFYHFLNRKLFLAGLLN